MTKRIFRDFHYTECDDFAMFLSNMAAEGWHFKGWQFGMIFEKGEPSKEVYVVDVFGDAKDIDTRPEANTKEFAEYCEAAGWEFVDSKKKFCVFRKITDDAVDIVTKEERLENAAKAEIKAVLLRIVGAALLAEIYVKDFFTSHFAYAIFHYSLIVITAIFGIQLLYHILYGIKTAVWWRKMKKQVSYDEDIYLGVGEQKQKKKYWGGCLLTVLTEFAIMFAFYLDNDIALIFPVAVGLLFLILCMGGLAYSRPSRVENFASVIVVSILVAVITVVAGLGFTGAEVWGKDEVPLVQEDYREVEVPFDEAQVQQKDNVFGKIADYWIIYSEYDEKADEVIYDELMYETYESEYTVILNRIWDILIEDTVSSQDCTELWGAKEAVFDYEYFPIYYVRYEDQIFVLKYEGNLTQEQVDVIREKMNLGQVK